MIIISICVGILAFGKEPVNKPKSFYNYPLFASYDFWIFEKNCKDIISDFHGANMYISFLEEKLLQKIQNFKYLRTPYDLILDYIQDWTKDHVLYIEITDNYLSTLLNIILALKIIHWNRKSIDDLKCIINKHKKTYSQIYKILYAIRAYKVNLASRDFFEAMPKHMKESILSFD